MILIADDSPTQAIFLRRILNGAGYNDITSVKDGQEAYEYLKSRGAALVLSDVNMPRLDGFELCKKIKTDPDLKKIPVMLCTTLSDPEDILKGLEANADSYITKPYQPNILLAQVDTLLRASPISVPEQQTKEEFTFGGKKYFFSVTTNRLLKFFFTSYQNMLDQNKELIKLQEELKKTNTQLEAVQNDQKQLLNNILPPAIAQELMAYGNVTPVRFDEATVMFMDFVGFTSSSHFLSPQDLVGALEFYFEAFDHIISRHNVERIKTIGDGYMCVGGVPTVSEGHAFDVIKAALEILAFVKENVEFVQEKNHIHWQIRIGINTGPLIAGVVGKKRFAYDIWGDTVNIASRMESSSEPNKINISESTYAKVKDFVQVQPRGKIPVKSSKVEPIFVEMYFVEKLSNSR
ncbi:MAG: adenylate/guanylate cyclase domain-containing protein [Chlamydiales bacterium]